MILKTTEGRFVCGFLWFPRHNLIRQIKISNYCNIYPPAASSCARWHSVAFKTNMLSFWPPITLSAGQWMSKMFKRNRRSDRTSERRSGISATPITLTVAMRHFTVSKIKKITRIQQTITERYREEEEIIKFLIHIEFWLLWINYYIFIPNFVWYKRDK